MIISKKIIIILLLLFAGMNVWAQRDFRKGYIITNQQDTIYGWIDYRGDTRNAKICSFKKTETEQATDYTPSDIAAYRFIDSKFYISSNTIDIVGAPKQIFLEYLVNGLAKLYYCREDNVNDRYYIENDGHFVELKVDRREVVVEGKYGRSYSGLQTVKSYVGLLKAMLNVWEMDSEIEKAELNHSSLIDIAKNYHQHVCTDGSECIVYERKKPLVALRIGPVIGADFSTLKLMDFKVEKYHLDPSTNLTVGVNLNLSMPRINEKIFLQMQAMYTKYYFFDAFESPQSQTDVHIRSNVLQMGFAIKYEYPKGKWRPTLAAGGAAIWMPDAAIKENTDRFYQVGIRPSTVEYDFPDRFMYGFEVISGIHYYLTPKRIIFIQVQYLQCDKWLFIRLPANMIRSFGLSTGIYF